MKDRTLYHCMDCRWCLCGNECRFFDTDKKESVAQNKAPTCPFFEDISISRKLDKISWSLDVIAEHLRRGR